MPRTVLTVQTISRSGISPTYSAMDAANNHSFDNTGHNIFVHVKNGDSSPHTVTFITPNSVDGLAVADLAITVANVDEALIGPFPAALYDTVDVDPVPDIDPAIFMDVDVATSMTVAILKLPGPTY